MKKFYDNDDHLTPTEKHKMWNKIEDSLPQTNSNIISLHWKSFWIGQAAAILLVMASIGIYSSSQFFYTSKTIEEQYDETLTSASDELSNLKPLILLQANERTKPSLESTIQGIEEIDRLIDELKEEIFINGISPEKKAQLQHLFATKLDFYKELILNNEDLL